MEKNNTTCKGSLSCGAGERKTTSSVRVLGGVPTLFVGDDPLPGMAYITYLPERARYADFRDAGYRLFSFSCFFGKQGINELSGIYPFADGIFEEKGNPNFRLFDEEVGRILAVCPDAYLLPRVNVSLPSWWEREHPDECNDVGIPPRPPRACFASTLWLGEVKRCLSLLISHIEKQAYRDRIIGYQIAGGQTEEWFPFDMAGGVGKASRTAFAEKYPDGGDEIAYRRHLNDTVANVLCALASHVKNATEHRLIVGSFYGYTLETPAWTSGHHSIMRLLHCPDIDFLCSPVSYVGLRAPGGDFPCMSVLNSIMLHGKLYFSECDIRTYLTRPLPACRPNSCPPGTYEGDVWQGRGDAWQSRQVLRAVFARQLTHGNALWWFDMFGGWFATPDMMEDMQRFRDIAEEALLAPDRTGVAALAVVAEDEQFLHVEGGSACTARGALGLCGTPYDIFEMGDMEYVLAHYRAVVFVAPHLSHAMRAVFARCTQQGIPYLVQDETYIPDAEDIRELCRTAGVHMYTDTQDVLYASRQYVALHAATAGTKVLHLPRACHITDLFGNRPPVYGNTVELQSAAYETHLFKLT